MVRLINKLLGDFWIVEKYIQNFIFDMTSIWYRGAYKGAVLPLDMKSIKLYFPRVFFLQGICAHCLIWSVDYFRKYKCFKEYIFYFIYFQRITSGLYKRCFMLRREWRRESNRGQKKIIIKEAEDKLATD